MNNIFNITIIGLIFGTLGTTLGGIIGVNLKKPSNKLLCFILSLASGLMTAVVSLDLIPEALKITNRNDVALGILFGIFFIIVCNFFVNNKLNKREEVKLIKKVKEEKIKNKTSKITQNNKQEKDLLKSGIITTIGLAVHNIPEGLAIGAGFESSNALGYSLALAILIHDIPEGISMAVPMKLGGVSKHKIVFYVLLSGLVTGIGAMIGKIIGGISKEIIGISLAFAAGVMIHIVLFELIPQANKLAKIKISILGTIVGYLLGYIAVNI